MIIFFMSEGFYISDFIDLFKEEVEEYKRRYNARRN